MTNKEKLKQLHKNFLASGQYLEARYVLRLLIKKNLKLTGYSDAVYNTESALAKILKPSYSRNCISVRFILKES